MAVGRARDRDGAPVDRYRRTAAADQRARMRGDMLEQRHADGQIMAPGHEPGERGWRRDGDHVADRRPGKRIYAVKAAWRTVADVPEQPLGQRQKHADTTSAQS